MKSDFGSTFGDRVKERREKLGFTQKELAMQVWQEACNASNATEKTVEQKRKNIVNYENGTFPKDIAVLGDLCTVLDCDIGYLLGEYNTLRRDGAIIQDLIGLSNLAADNLEVAASGPEDGPINFDKFSNTRADLRSAEIGRLAKIRFLDVLLQSNDLWEKIAVCAYDYRRYTQQAEMESEYTIAGYPLSLFADIVKESAKEALAELFKKIDWNVYSDEWEE